MSDFTGIQIFICAIGFLLVIPMSVAFLIYKDAIANRLENPEIWAALSIVLPVLGLIIYLIVRTSKTVTSDGFQDGLNEYKGMLKKHPQHRTNDVVESGPVQRYKR